MKMRDGLDRVTRNPEKQIIELGKLMGCDMRISTPIDGSTSDERHNCHQLEGSQCKGTQTDIPKVH